MEVRSSSKYRLCKLKPKLRGDIYAILLDTFDDSTLVESQVLHFKQSAIVYKGKLIQCLVQLHKMSEHVEEVL